ncbi:hypothetical protein BGZ46_005141 [Entomortierella lignicola]|nr:hypothetical protein BGZ46_005141 [Entomortierella lignicola]
MAGRMIKSWPNDNGDIVLSDLRNVGVYSMLILPEKSVQQPIPCLIYPNPDYSVMSSSTSSKQGDHVRAIANMDSTLGALERQLELRRKKIQHFEQLLTSKKQIIQDCQEVLDGPLRFAFNTGHLSEDAMPPEVVAIFQKRKSERRKQILERLIPIVGETAMTEFTLDTRVEGDIAEHSIHPLHVLECASGWITSSVGGVAWVGTNVENQSNQSLFNIRLSISLSCSHGRSLSQLEPGSTGLLISFVRMGVSDIYDDHDDCFDLSLVTKRLMSGSVQLHLDRKLDQKGPEMYHSTVPITNITFLEYCPKIWRSALDDIILPYSIRCQLNGITAKRFSVLAQDGLLLSLSDENTTFGSMEEDLIVKIVPSAHSLISGKHENSLDVLFRAKTEALAVEYAKKAALLCSRFV